MPILISPLSFLNWNQMSIMLKLAHVQFLLLATDLNLTDKRQCQIVRKIKMKRKNKSKSIIPKGFFLSLHFSLNSRIIFFISSSTAALDGAHTRTRFCLILALKFSSEWPFLWFYNLSHSRQTTMSSSLGNQIFACKFSQWLK